MEQVFAVDEEVNQEEEDAEKEEGIEQILVEEEDEGLDIPFNVVQIPENWDV